MTTEPLTCNSSKKSRFDEKYLEQALESIFPFRHKSINISQLKGDASTRIYFRVTSKNESEPNDQHSVIVMQLDQAVEGDEIDFTLILKFLKKLNLPVPELFHYDSSKGLLFIEDCGDITFEEMVNDSSRAEKKRYYSQAIKTLINMQYSGLQNITPDNPAYHLRFDVDKLMFEFDFMLENFVDRLRNVTSTDSERHKLRDQLRELCTTLTEEEVCFTHRDFHSRNLMIQNNTIKILDFQDARMGPWQYDLASLLKDSYVDLNENFVNDMVNLYIDLKEEINGQEVDRIKFRNIFDLMSIQRNLKAIGSFAYLSVSRNNDRYLEYIPRTLGYVRETFGRHPELSPLKNSLSKIIPELV
ncbi:MAG: aminoglycoside phosphotransferase family protein [Nitrospinales bacterium]